MYPLTCIKCIRIVVMNCLNISHCLDNSSVQYKTDTHIKKQKCYLIQDNLQHVQVHQARCIIEDENVGYLILRGREYTHTFEQV